MDEKCTICGFNEEVINQFDDKRVLRICDNCLQDDKINPLLDRLFDTL